MKFSIKSVNEIDENPFDRQERIPWWKQDILRDSKVMVVGAGAIGNETIKNLALLGVGNIFIVDFDRIETTNLSRTVLFNKSHKNQRKAEIAAVKARELSVLEHVCIDWYHGDIVWELGTGVFRAMDIVLGCLDNIETRLAVNRQCWLSNTPWIDAGISSLAGHVTVYTPPHSSCYQCNISSHQLTESRKRYSCDEFIRSSIDHGKVPTVQIASAFVSSLQTQEAIKLLCGQDVEAGVKIVFEGMINDFDKINLKKNKNCQVHFSYPDIVSIPISSADKLKTFLEYVSQSHLSGRGAILDLGGDRTFIEQVSCRICGAPITLNKPTFRIYDYEIICSRCRVNNRQENNHQEMLDKVMHHQFSLSGTNDGILKMSLRDIGVPLLHVIGVKNHAGHYQYYELGGDAQRLFSNIQ